MEQLLEKYRQLNEGEQRLTLMAAIALVVVIFYYGIWSPLNSDLVNGRAVVEKRQQDLIWVQQNAQKAMLLNRSGQSNTSFTGSLSQTVNKSASRFNIAISRMQPQGEELQVKVDQAPFNDVLTWLQELERQGIAIINVDLSESDEQGFVKVRKLQIGKS